MIAVPTLVQFVIVIRRIVVIVLAFRLGLLYIDRTNLEGLIYSPSLNVSHEH